MEELEYVRKKFVEGTYRRGKSRNMYVRNLLREHTEEGKAGICT